MANKRYYVYMMANRSRTLYTGFTNTIGRRVWEHKQGLVPGFTRKYEVHRLVYFEVYTDVRRAIEREKEIKAWRREKKVALVESVNPTWHDLAEAWYRPLNQKKQVPHLSSRRAGGQIRNDNAGSRRAG
jgi:putative endonuclease